MIEQLQMILTTIGDLGEYAVWVVVAFFVWKLVTLASVLVLIKHGIDKLHDIVVKHINRPKVNYIKVGGIKTSYQFDEDSVRSEDANAALTNLFNAIIDRSHGNDTRVTRVLFYQDVHKAAQIIKDAKLD
jgi:hypothetical protein